MQQRRIVDATEAAARALRRVEEVKKKRDDLEIRFFQRKKMLCQEHGGNV